jgi:hypothetical protein
VSIWHRLGVYFGVSEESDEDRLFREASESRAAGYPGWRIALNALLTFLLGTLVAGLLWCLAFDSQSVTLANLVSEGWPFALIATAGGLFRDLYVRKHIREAAHNGSPP